MMKNLKLQLLGTPKIIMKNEQVYLPYVKAEALLYYMAVNKTVNRAEIAQLLWPDKELLVAKKNLRNAIYQINKEFKEDVFKSPNKSSLQFNRLITVDIDSFEKNPESESDLYTDCFLKGFRLKNLNEFNNWIIKTRDHFEHIYIEYSNEVIERKINNNELEKLESKIHKLISIKKDESSYQLLMKFFMNKNMDKRVIETYFNLLNSLNQVGQFKPSKETLDLYKMAFKRLSNKNTNNEIGSEYKFYGREKEIALIESDLDNFFEKANYSSILIHGSVGIGKSALCDLIIGNIQNNCNILKITCFHSEQNYTLRPWREVVKKVGKVLKKLDYKNMDLWNKTCIKFFPYFSNKALKNYDSKMTDEDINDFTQVLLDVFHKIETTSKLIIHIENFQWMDNVSLKVLMNLMLHDDHALFMIVLRDGYKREIDDFISILTHYEKLLAVHISPFSEESIPLFIEKQLPLGIFERGTFQKLYSESEGNPLLLMEYVNQLKLKDDFEPFTKRINSEFEFIIQDLSIEEIKLLQVLSFFSEDTQISIIVELLGDTRENIIEILEAIENRKLVKEQLVGNKIYIEFVHNKFKEYIYNSQSLSKVRLTHKKIALLLQEKVKFKKNDANLLSQISYHFELANEEIESIKYELEYLGIYLKFKHESFPIYDEYNKGSFDIQPVKWQKEFEKFKKIGVRLKSINGNMDNSQEYRLLLTKYLYFEGRYLMNYGEYIKGIEDIRQSISQAKQDHNNEILRKCYLQMIYYYIQTDDDSEMEHYINLAMQMAIKTNNHELIGILLRLKGLYYLMIGNLKDAESMLNESIRTFSISDEVRDKYSSNIAASYDYLSEIERINGNYDVAVKYGKMAVGLCEGTNLKTSLAIFYIGLGITYFNKGDYKNSKLFLSRANGLYENVTSTWKRTQLESYICLLELKFMTFDKVYHFMNIFTENKILTLNTREKGIVYFVKSIFKKMITQGVIVDDILERDLEKDEDFYYFKAQSFLNNNRDTLELKILDDFFNGKIDSFSN